MSELEFQRCLKEISNGKKDSLKIIYDNYGHVIYFYALSIIKCESLAKDICQDVFIKIWNGRSKYKNNSNHKSWIMTITRNTAIDYLRRYNREVLLDEFNIVDNKDMIEEVNEKLQIKEALESLNDEEREVVVLHIITDLTFKNIGEILNKPIGTVTWRYREAIKKLRKKVML